MAPLDEPPKEDVLRRGQLARKLNGEIVSWEVRQVTLTVDHLTISADAAEKGMEASMVRERIKLLDITSLGAIGDSNADAEAIQQAHSSSYSGGLDDEDNLTRKLKIIESLTNEKIHKEIQRGTFHGLEYMNAFKIHVAHLGRTYYFKARTLSETSAWIAG